MNGTIVGHTREIAMVNELVKHDRFPHAVMIEGPKGVGKSLFAHYIASVLICGLPVGNDEDRDINSRVLNHKHPDLKYVEPGENVIKKEEMEEIVNSQALKPFESEKRACIIDCFDRVSPEGQNAMLKTLEESPDFLYIIMTTDRPDAVLQTVRSRVRSISLFCIEDGIIEEYLRSRKIENAEALAVLAGGSPGRAISIIEDDGYRKRFEDTLRFADRLLKGDETAVYDMSIFFEDEKAHYSEMLDILALYLKDIAVFYSTGDDSLLRFKSRILTGHFDSLDIGGLRRSISEIERVKQGIRGNANFTLNLELLFSDIQGVHVFG